jgi:type I restriction enzyme S subunit
MGARVVSGEFVYVSPTKAKALSNNLARPGDLVFTQRGTLGQVAIVPSGEFSHYVVSQSQMKVSLDRERHDPSFVYHYFASRAGQAQIVESAIQTGVPHTNLGILKSYWFPAPPLEEQRTIAQALNDADSLLDGISSLIDKKRGHKEAPMQQLLTGRTRLPRFAEEWREHQLGSEISDLEAGASVRSVRGDVEGTSAILKTSAIVGGRFIPAEAKRIAPADIHRVHLYPRADTVLISRMNTVDLVGECGYVDSDYPNLFIPDRIWMTKLRPNTTMSAKWLAYFLSSDVARRKLRDIATGTSGSMKNISKSALLGLAFRLPSRDEQTAIANVLSDMDAEIAALEARLEKTKALKQAMMQKLLTGRTRLVAPEPAHA